MALKNPPVKPGQLWSYIRSAKIGDRIAMRVERVAEGAGNLRAHGTSDAGIAVEIDVSTLRRGQRGAVLLETEPGVPYVRPLALAQQKRRVTPKARAAVALLDEGKSLGHVASSYGVDVATVRRWRLEVAAEAGAKP